MNRKNKVKKEVRRIPDIIYIPYDPNDEELRTARERLVAQFLNGGWRRLGASRIHDIYGEIFYFWILTKEA